MTPLLFVRERADERAGVTMAFRYLRAGGSGRGRWGTPDYDRVAIEIRDAAGGAGCGRVAGVR